MDVVRETGIALVRVVAGPSFKGSPANDSQIHPKRPVLNVVQVELHTLFHLVQRVSFATETMNLRPACDARFDAMSHHVQIQ